MQPRLAAVIAVAIAAAAPAAAEPPTGAIRRIEHTPLGDAPSRGPRAALVTLEVYFSPGSELGNQAYRRAVGLWRRHPARLRLVFRPLLRSDASQYVAPLVIAAHARGRFFELMDELAGRGGPQATPDAVIEVAVRAGIDRAVAIAAVTDPKTQALLKPALDVNHRRSVRARIGQRADLVLNGRPLGPTPDDNTLETAYDSALARARIERAAGAAPGALAALAARRQRCLEARERLRPRRGPAYLDEATPADDDDDATAPVAGWHLGALLRDGTGCQPEPVPTGRVDQAYDYERAHQAPRATLLATPLADAGLPSCGPVTAPVVVHVVCNLRNPTCADQLVRARRVAVDYAPSVRVVYRPWAELELEDASLELGVAEAVMCSQRLGDGWRFVAELRGQALDDAHLAHAAVAAGIDPDAFAACIEAPPLAARQAIDAARAAGIGWAPTVIIGQRAYVGGLTDDRPMKDLIDAELAPGLLGAGDLGTDDPAAAATANTCADR